MAAHQRIYFLLVYLFCISSEVITQSSPPTSGMKLKTESKTDMVTVSSSSSTPWEITHWYRDVTDVLWDDFKGK